MKKLILAICLVLSFGITSAQSNYEKGMAKGMEMLKASKTAEEFVSVANHFERIANVEKNEWLPLYWNAYAYLFAGMNAKKDSEQDGYYDKALSVLESINNANMDRSEYLTLKGYIKLMKISVSPMTRAPLGTGDAMGNLTEAQKVNPKNPRPVYVMGQNTFYTPEFFGGGKEAAKPLLTNAVNLYAAETASTDYMPRWGKGRAEYLLKECK
jgi:hypothetical protein